jgi:hypothetical protein
MTRRNFHSIVVGSVLGFFSVYRGFGETEFDNRMDLVDRAMKESYQDIVRDQLRATLSLVSLSGRG